MIDQLVKRLLALTDILVETGDTGWANTTRAAAKRITEYDYDLAALQAVHDLHKRIWLDGREYCKHCVDFGGEYPCPTVQAIQDAIKETDT